MQTDSGGCSSREISNLSHLNINQGLIAASDPPDSDSRAAKGFIIYTATFIKQINRSQRCFGRLGRARWIALSCSLC